VSLLVGEVRLLRRRFAVDGLLESLQLVRIRVVADMCVRVKENTGGWPFDWLNKDRKCGNRRPKVVPPRIDQRRNVVAKPGKATDPRLTDTPPEDGGGSEGVRKNKKGKKTEPLAASNTPT